MEVKQHDHRRITDPSITGPGIWVKLHIDSSQAKTSEEKEHVIWGIRATQKKFPCGKCRIHMGEYLERNPPEKTLDGDPESLFRWVWSFHNLVNTFNKREQVPFEDARKLFWSDDSIVCMADCTHEKPIVTPTVSNLTTTKKIAPLILTPVRIM
jgi:hypothetical protein